MKANSTTSSLELDILHDLVHFDLLLRFFFLDREEGHDLCLLRLGHDSVMDLEVRQELHTTIEKVTHSGNPSLDLGDLKKIKAICRQGDINIRTAYELLMHTLGEEHAEVRLSTFQVISDLFTRSSLFRELLTADFKTFASLVTGTDTQCPLPPPKEAAARLKKSSLLAIREWNQKYSHGYPKLKLGFNFLKFNKKVDFDLLVAQNEAERRRRSEREARQRTILQQRIQEVKQEMIELRCDIDGCLMEMESCFNLLLPRFELPDIYSTSNTTCQDTAFNQNTFNQDSSISLEPAGSHSKSGVQTRRRTKTTSSSGSFVSLSEGSESEMSDCESDGGDRAEHSGQEHGGPEHGGPGSEGQSGTGHTEKGNLDIKPSDLILESDSDSDVEWEEVEPAVGAAELGVELQEHGMASQGFSVPVQLSRRVEVRETDDNSSILATLHERRQLLLSHHLPTLNKCMEWMTKAGEGESVRSAIDLKGKITSSLNKYNKLNIIFKKPPPQEEPTDKPQPPPPAITHTDPEWKFGTDVPPSVPVADLALDPTTPQAQLAVLKKKLSNKVPPPSSSGPSEHAQSSEPKSSSSRSATILSQAPVVPFGMDLYHWENSESSVEPRRLAPVGSLHRFWVQETEISISKDEQDRLKCRTISFPGQFQPVLKSCRALLPSGKLCPRKDRYKCPFHGPIIPRDEAGCPVGDAHQDGGQLLSSASRDDPPLWQDEVLQQEVMAAKGIDLAPKNEKGKRKGPGKRKSKFPGLTDLKADVDSPRKRVERKVLNKRSLKRVSERVNELATKKYNDKFGDSFNYALKN